MTTVFSILILLKIIPRLKNHDTHHKTVNFPRYDFLFQTTRYIRVLNSSEVSLQIQIIIHFQMHIMTRIMHLTHFKTRQIDAF